MLLFWFCIQTRAAELQFPQPGSKLGELAMIEQITEEAQPGKNQCQQAISSPEMAEMPEVSAALDYEPGRSLVTINWTGC